MIRRQHVAAGCLLTACGLGLACHSEGGGTRDPLVVDLGDTATSTPLGEVELSCGERPFELVVDDSGGCFEDCDGTRWCWGADLRAKRAKPDEPDGFESGYLACLRDPEHGAVCREPRGHVEIVVVDELGHADHVCAVNRNAEVICAGDNRYAQLGLGHTSRYIFGVDKAKLPNSARAVGVAGNHTCAALDDRIMCWGMPTKAGHESHRFKFEAVDIQVDGSLSCARKTDGTVWCWGAPDQEGYATEDQFGGVEVGALPRKVNIPWQADAVGSSWVYGKQVLRHVGLDGDLTAGADDVVWQTSRVREAAAALNVVCVHWLNGRLRCVEADVPDALEPAVGNTDGEQEDFYPEIDHVSDFSLGSDSVCVSRHGKVQCATSVGGWTEVEGIDAATRVANSCAVEATGTVTCWSREDANGYYISKVWPTRAHDAVDIAADFVLTKRGSLELIERSGALVVLIDRGVVQFDGAETHVCARVDDDGDGRSETIECLGSNDVGQLGKPSDALIRAPKAILFEPG
jgi:hypothetical protein